MNGFTIEVDGPPEYIERLLAAFTAEWARIIEEATREQDSEFARLLGYRHHARPVNPVHGTLSTRSTL